MITCSVVTQVFFFSLSHFPHFIAYSRKFCPLLFLHHWAQMCVTCIFIFFKFFRYKSTRKNLLCHSNRWSFSICLLLFVFGTNYIYACISVASLFVDVRDITNVCWSSDENVYTYEYMRNSFRFHVFIFKTEIYRIVPHENDPQIMVFKVETQNGNTKRNYALKEWKINK